MLVFTGVSRYASEVAKSTIENLGTREAELRRMSQMVDEAITILQQPVHSIDNFGRLLDEAWQLKRSVSSQISTSGIDEIYQVGREAGAIGGKLLGAGGGGFVLFFAAPEAQQRIRERLGNLIHVPFRFETAGSRIVLYQPQGLT
jgi:D-glycero-alpha-D-manno-heptose-7-phosphate kinase